MRREDIVAEARSWIGTPYKHQASLKGVGCDCLGLVRGVWRAVKGVEPEAVPAYSPDWAEASQSESLAAAASRHFSSVALTEIAPGDVLLFRWRAGFVAKHAAIVTEWDGEVGSAPRGAAPARMVHAHDGAAVAEVAVTPWWRRRLAYAFCFRD